MTAPLRLVRLPDWQLRLETFVNARQALPFAWGSNDCCLFAADAVLALTGHDFAARLRGSYSTTVQAGRRLRARGGVAGIASKALGAPVRPLQANVGDIVQVRIGAHDALGVCNGVTVLGPSPAGIVAVSLRLAQAAWRVG